MFMVNCAHVHANWKYSQMFLKCCNLLWVFDVVMILCDKKKLQCHVQRETQSVWETFSPPGSLQCLWNEMTASHSDGHCIAVRAREWKVWCSLGFICVCAGNTADELMRVYGRTNTYKVIEDTCTFSRSSSLIRSRCETHKCTNTQ